MVVPMDKLAAMHSAFARGEAHPKVHTQVGNLLFLSRAVKYRLSGPEITYVRTVYTKYAYLLQNTPRL